MDIRFVVISVLLMIADELTVRGPSGPLMAPLGSSLVLPCYVDELLLMEGLEVEWRRKDSETLVHLFLDGKSRAEVQQQDYLDRAHFFTNQIQHGNFSLRLDSLTAEDEGKYTCKVYSPQDSGETVVKITGFECLLVSRSSRSVSVYDGEDVTLNCSVDSHITPEHIEEVSWKRTGEDEEILVLLYQNNETFPDSSDEQYRDRVKFFPDEIPKGNFSLRLKRVRTEDTGVYTCQVFAGALSDRATVILEQLDPADFSRFTQDLSAQASQLMMHHQELTRLTSMTEELVKAVQSLHPTPATADAPLPRQEPPTAPVTRPTSSPRLAFLEQFDGTPAKCKGFLMQCSIFLAQQPTLYFPDSAAQTVEVEDTLKTLFRQALNEELQSELACRDEDKSLDQFIQLAIRIDNVICSRRGPRSGGNPMLSQPLDSSDEPMQIGRTHISSEERERRI
ncbi:uncharacterized protein [Pseudorasbora parva]|uniref:uncharacterized protein n=1 Tax=Pseudorasbora parva TaxID=51549 RepID=UPI00351E7B1F